MKKRERENPRYKKGGDFLASGERVRGIHFLKGERGPDGKQEWANTQARLLPQAEEIEVPLGT